MEKLSIKFRGLLSKISTEYIRNLYYKIDWNSRGIAIIGARGVGKSTLLLQYAKLNLPIEKSLYITLDDLYFTENTLSSVIDEFYVLGGRHLLIDEVHKYPNWETEIKNAYDFYPDLQIILTGSSVVALKKAQVDLSRRIAHYYLTELSFREYLGIMYSFDFPVVTIDELIENNAILTSEWVSTLISPVKYYQEYIQYGAYPFIKQNKLDYLTRINQIITVIIDYDLPQVQPIEVQTLFKIKRLLFILSRSVPFKPNINKLSQQLETGRNHILTHLHSLEQAGLIHNLKTSTSGISLMNKPEKIYLRNTNLIYALAEGMPDVGNIRETVLLSWLINAGLRVDYPKQGDFLLNDSITVEVGGKEKGYQQIKDIPNAIIAADGIEHGFQRKIPLWAFGFLY
ncbi:MAG: ATP-binding protein [Bacteroidetes bacterium]|nr:ATP-binding protein [Bacteroidota bacterium]